MKVLLKHHNVQTVEVLKQYNNVEDVKITRDNTGDFYIVFRMNINIVKKLYIIK